MRILILVNKLSGGGAERVASLWANGFVERGYKVGIVVNCRKRYIRYPLSEEVVVFNTYSSLRQILKKITNYKLSFIPNLKKIINEFRPNIIIGVMHPWAEYARLAQRGECIPIINTEHNAFEWPANAPKKTILIKEQKYEWNKRYDHVTVLTEADKKCVTGILENVSVMPNPLSFEPLDNIPDKENIILAVGRLDAWYVKGFDILIKAWGMISQDFPNWKLQIVGSGNKKILKYFRKLISENNIGKQTELLGYQDDVSPFYKKASIFVMPSRYEGFGMVLIEAMSQGCACIACDYNGRQREIILSENEGVLCPVDDIYSLSNAIRRLIEDEKYRNIIQHGAIVRSKYFDIHKIMDRWDEILHYYI